MTRNDVACRAAKRTCGSPAGWRAGGRCPKCRRAHNAEVSRYRGLTSSEREKVLTALRAGSTPEEAAAAIGKSVRHLTQPAGRDGELRAALDGAPLAAQLVARRGDYLAALTRAGGNRLEASRELGLKPHTVNGWRSDRLFAAAEDAVRALIEGYQVAPRIPGQVSEAQLDHATDLILSGTSIVRAAREVGCDPSTLRYRAPGHPRLKRALAEAQPRKGKPSRLTDEVAARLKTEWANPSRTVANIAQDLGVSASTVWRWREQLNLPLRQR